MKIALLGLLPALALCQTNLQFQNGTAGQVPPGWFVLDTVKDSGYAAVWQREGCRAALPCVLLSAPAHPPAQSFGTLMQSFSAAPFRGKRVRFRAWIKLDGKSAADHAQMLLHVSRRNGEPSFVDNMADRPITAGDWRQFEIAGEVAADAVTIRIGVLLYSTGCAWVSDVTFDTATGETSGPAVDAARAAIEKQYARIDAAFVRGDTDEIGALVMPEALMGVGTIREPLLPAIAQEIAKGNKLTTRTTISSVRTDGDEAIVMVRREARDPLADGKRTVVTSHRDTWIQTANGWRWRESIEISYHWILPPTTPESARPVAAEIKKRATPLLGADDARTVAAAIGDAQIVVLGEAARGTREFTQWKERLVEYLVAQKGFTIVAAANEADVHDLVKRLHAAYAPMASIASSQAKTVVWTDNAHARDFHEKLGRKVYAIAFAFRRGAIKAVGVEGGESRGMNVYTTNESAEGSGDALLSAAGVPAFFLNLSAVPGGPLGRWLGESHLFHNLGAYWVLDDPEASLQPDELGKNYDGLIFIEEVHARQ